MCRLSIYNRVAMSLKNTKLQYFNSITQLTMKWRSIFQYCPDPIFQKQAKMVTNLCQINTYENWHFQQSKLWAQTIFTSYIEGKSQFHGWKPWKMCVHQSYQSTKRFGWITNHKGTSQPLVDHDVGDCRWHRRSNSLIVAIQGISFDFELQREMIYYRLLTWYTLQFYPSSCQMLQDCILCNTDERMHSLITTSS